MVTALTLQLPIWDMLLNVAHMNEMRWMNERTNKRRNEGTNEWMKRFWSPLVEVIACGLISIIKPLLPSVDFELCYQGYHQQDSLVFIPGYCLNTHCSLEYTRKMRLNFTHLKSEPYPQSYNKLIPWQLYFASLLCPSYEKQPHWHPFQLIDITDHYQMVIIFSI